MVTNLIQYSAVNQVMYLMTGIIQTICFQVLVYHGAGEKTTLLPVLARYAGVAMAVLLPSKNKNSIGIWTTRVYIKLLTLGILNFSAVICQITGIYYAGSGLYQVVYSSGIIFTALISKIWTGKQLNSQQWSAIIVVWVGLVFGGIGATSNVSAIGEMHEETHEVVEHGHQVFGIVFTLIACLIFSFHNVLAETYINEKSPIGPELVQSFSGVFCLMLSLGYVSCFTIPQWKIVFTTNVEIHNGDISVIVAMFLAIILSSFLHSASLYILLGSVGAVVAGIIQCVRAVSVFIISSWLFCSVYPQQCFSIYKGIATFMVTCGVLYFSHHSVNPKKRVYAVDKMNQEEIP